MKMPVLTKTTARFFPDQEFKAATTRTTIKGHVTGRRYYSPLKSRENLISRILKKGLGHSSLVWKPWKEQAKRLKQNRFSYPWTKGISILPNMAFAGSQAQKRWGIGWRIKEP